MHFVVSVLLFLLCVPSLFFSFLIVSSPLLCSALLFSSPFFSVRQLSFLRCVSLLKKKIGALVFQKASWNNVPLF